MAKPSDEKLIAYLDGELPEDERAAIAGALEEDAALRERALRLSESAALLRSAFAEIEHEPLPERLIAAARGETTGRVVPLVTRLRRHMGDRRWWIGIPLAASLAGLLVGGGLGFFAGGETGITETRQASIDVAAANWLDSIAGYHKLFVNAGPNDVALADVPAIAGAPRKGLEKLPPDVRMPNLKPWGLVFQGARFLIVDGRPATQLFYTTPNKQLGPITFVIGGTRQPDVAPTLDRRDGLNLFYWRHHGHAYTLVGSADVGYLWNIANDIAWQLDAI